MEARRTVDAARARLAALVALGAFVAGGCQAYDHALLARLLDGGGGDGAAAGCDAGLPRCGARCVDLLNDPTNCGRCDYACAAGEACVAGACAASGPDASVDAAEDVVDVAPQADAAPDALDAGEDDRVAVDDAADVAPQPDAAAEDVAMDAPEPDAAVDAGAMDVPVLDVPRDVPVSVDAPHDAGGVDVPRIVAPPAFRGVTTAFIPAGSGCCITVSRPTAAAPGDLLVAVVALGVSGATMLPTMTPPPGWTLVRRTDHSAMTLSLWVFWHVEGATEPASYTFSTDRGALGGVASIVAYGGADDASPIDTSAGADLGTAGTSYAAPSVTTTQPETVVLSLVAGHGGTAVTWTPPAGTSERADVNDGTTRDLLVAEAVQPVAGATGARTATASATLQYAVAATVAIDPAP